MSYNKNLKKLLTASMLAGLAFTAGEAGAVVRDIDTGAGDLALNIATNNAGNIVGQFATGVDSLKFLSAQDLKINATAPVNILAIDLNDKDLSAKTITVSTTGATIGAIGLKGAGGGTAGREVKLVVNDGMTLTLSGTAGGAVLAGDYSGLGAVTIGSGAGAASTVNIATGTNGGTFGVAAKFNDSTVGSTSNLNITSGVNTFAAEIGDAGAIANLNISSPGATTFNKSVDATNITTTGTGTTSFGDNVTITSGVAGAHLSIGSGTTVAFGTDGKELDLGDGSGVVTFNAITGAGTLAINADTIIKNTGAVNPSATNIGSATTSLAGINVAATKTLTFSPQGANAGMHVYAPVTAGATTAKLAMTAGAAAPVTFHDDVGTSTVKFEELLLTGAHDAISLDADKSIYANAIKFGNAASAATLNAGSALHGKVTAGAGHNGLININGANAVIDSFDNTNVFGRVVFADKASVKVNGASTTAQNIKIDEINMAAATDASTTFEVDMTNMAASNPLTLTVGRNGTDNKGILASGTAASAGTVKFTNPNKNSITIATEGVNITNIGAAGKALALIDADGSNLTLESKKATDVINVSQINADKLTLKATGADVKFTIGGLTTTAATNPLTISADGQKVTLGAGTNLGTLSDIKLVNDSTLELADGVNLNSTGAIVSDVAGNKGQLNLVGASTLGNGTLGTQANPLKAIVMSNSTKTVTFGTGDIWSLGGIDTNGAGANTAIINGNVHGKIDASAGANSIVTFASASTVDGDLGNSNAIARVNIGADTSIAATGGTKYQATNTTFTSDSTLTLGATLTNTTLGTVTTTKGNGTGAIVLNKAATLQAIGASGAALKSVTMNVNDTLTVGAQDIYANLLPGSNGSATAAIASSGKTIHGDVGSANLAFNNVTVTTNATTTVNNIYSVKTTFTGQTKLIAQTITASDATTGISFDNAASELQIKDGGSISGITTATTDDKGTITFLGDATIEDNLGQSNITRHAQVNFNGATKDKVVTFNGSVINSKLINHQGATLKLTEDTTFNVDNAGAGYTINGGIADIGTNDFQMPNGKITIGANGATFKVDVSSGHGHVVQGAGLAVASAPGQKINFSSTGTNGFPINNGLFNIFVDQNNTPVAITNGSNADVTFAEGRAVKAGYLDAAFIALPANANLVAAITAANGATAPVAGQGYYTVNLTDNILIGSRDNLDSETLKAVDSIIADFADGGLTGDIANAVAAWTAPGTTVQTSIEGIKKLSPIDAQTAMAASTTDAVNDTLGVTGSRMSATTTKVVANDSGVAAGDSAEKFGVWAEIMGSQATQKFRKNVAGYQSKSFGAVIGADTMLNDNALVGMIAGNSSGSIKHKDARAGDKTKTSSWLFGIYGNYDIGETNYFVQGNFVVAQTAVKSKEARVATVVNGATTYEKASSKYDILGYGAQVLGGYKYQFDNSYIVPTAGLGFNYLGDTSYTQTGTQYQNAKVSTKAKSTLSALGGVKFGTSVDMDGTTVLPEVHMNVRYAFNSPSAKSNITLNGLSNPIQYKGAKAAKFAYNFGTAVMAQSEGLEYGVGYDADISDKYLSHKGSLKFRVMF